MIAYRESVAGDAMRAGASSMARGVWGPGFGGAPPASEPVTGQHVGERTRHRAQHLAAEVARRAAEAASAVGDDVEHRSVAGDLGRSELAHPGVAVARLRAIELV